MPLLSLLLVLLLLGLVLCAIATLLISHAILHPPRMTDGKAIYLLRRLSPGDLGLRFEIESFTVRDARSGRPLHIAGWWIPHSSASGRCVILLHGYGDAKVGAISFAPLLHQLGLNILAIDLRAHGESGGRHSTGGFFERDDLNQVIDQLISTRPDDARQLILFGISLGAAVAAATAATRHDLSAVILESPYADFSRVVDAHLRLLGLPRDIVRRAALRWAEILCGAKFSNVRPTDLIPRISSPLLVILGGEDELLDSDDIAALRQAVDRRPATAGLSAFIIIPGASHLMAMDVAPAEYAAQITSFMETALSARQFVST